MASEDDWQYFPFLFISTLIVSFDEVSLNYGDILGLNYQILVATSQVL